MRSKFLITLGIIVIVLVAGFFALKTFVWEKEPQQQETTEIMAEAPPLEPAPDMDMHPEPYEEGMEFDPLEDPIPLEGEVSPEGQIPSEEYDYSYPGQVFDDIDKIKDEYTGRHDYIYDENNVNIAKNFGIYQTGKKNPFSEIYSLDDYKFDQNIVIPNESSN